MHIPGGAVSFTGIFADNRVKYYGEPAQKKLDTLIHDMRYWEICLQV